jgi:hypothetical protein
MAKIVSPYRPKDEQNLMAHIWDKTLADDPLAFVMFIFPWGKKGTPLEKFKGPRKWQREELNNIKNHIAANKNLIAQKKAPLVYQSATASGRGPGKSALVSWLVLWAMSTRLGSTAIVTANTENQLKTRTWAELGKWHTLALNGHWFERSALSLKPAEWFDEALKRDLKVDTGYYYASAQLWSEENPDAFAGVHNHNGIIVIYDEASGIPEAIWNVTEGFFTEPILDRYWFVFSNPRRNTGSFFECFHRFRDYWRRRNLDSRDVEGTDKNVLNQIISKHGLDSDPARIEVLGQFPNTGDRQFISRDIVAAARQRETEEDQWAPLIMGVDPARFGDDSTVICFRQGRNGRVIPHKRLKGADNMAVANECAFLIQKYNPDAVCIDAGNGTGIIDRLREMKYKVHEVWFGHASPEQEYSNYRTYIWAKMRDWLGGGCIENNQELVDDLVAVEYKFMGVTDKLRLETKEELKARGFSSPDFADAFACTFAVNVARKDLNVAAGRRKNHVARDLDYNFFG